jgi:hypothetical protein
MGFSQNSNNRPAKNIYEKNYSLIRSCLDERHDSDREITNDRLAQEQGVIAHLRRLLFQNPFITNLAIVILLLLLLYLSSLVVSRITDNIYIRLFYLLIATFLYLIFAIFHSENHP